MQSDLIRYLWTVTVQSSALILGIFLIRRLFGDRLSARFRYAMWLPVLIRLMIPFSVPGKKGVMGAVAPVTERLTRQLVIVGEYALPAAAHEGARGMAAASETGAMIPWGTIILILWAAGVVFLCGITLAYNINLRAQIKKDRSLINVDDVLEPLCREMGIRRLPAVYVSGRVTSPCVIGCFRPWICLTNRAAGKAYIESVLRHELAHIRRRDNLTAVLRAMCCAAYWFDPLVWLAGCCAHQDCEMACDETAMAGMNDEERRMYGMALIAQLKNGVPAFRAVQTAATLSMGRREMKRRVARIGRRVVISPWARACACVLLAAVFISGAMFAPEAESAVSVTTDGREAAATETPLTETTPETQKQTEVEDETVSLLAAKPEDQLCIGILPTETGGSMVYYVPEAALQQEIVTRIQALDARKLAKHEIPPDWLMDAPEYNIYIYNGDFSLNLHMGGAIDIEGWRDYERLGRWVAEDAAFERYVLGVLAENAGFSPFDIGRIRDITAARLETGPRYTGIPAEPMLLTDRTALAKVEELLSQAAPSFWSQCPFGNCRLVLTTGTGDEITLCMAADSCTCFYADGVFYDYMPQEYRNGEEHPDNTIFFELFGVTAEYFLN